MDSSSNRKLQIENIFLAYTYGGVVFSLQFFTIVANFGNIKKEGPLMFSRQVHEPLVIYFPNYTLTIHKSFMKMLENLKGCLSKTCLERNDKITPSFTGSFHGHHHF